jgi:hypothetical protein
MSPNGDALSDVTVGQVSDTEEPNQLTTSKVVLHADVAFEVRSNGEKFGQLRDTKGTIDWYPANAKRPTRLTWEQFDRLMSGQ